MEIFYNDTSDDLNNGIDDSPSSAEDTAAGIQEKLLYAKSLTSIVSRFNKVLKASHHASSTLNHVMQCPGMMAFRLVATMLLSFYGMVKMLMNPDQADAVKIAKLLQAHVVLALLVTSLLAPVSSIPIMFVLCSNDFMNNSFELFFNYQTLLDAAKAVQDDTPLPSASDAKKLLCDKLKLHNKLIQKLIIVALAIVGVGLIINPASQLAGTTLLLLTTMGGMGTSLFKPIPWHEIGQNAGKLGMFACKKAESLGLHAADWQKPTHCVVM